MESLSECLDRLRFVPSFFTMDINCTYKLRTLQNKLNDPEECDYIDFVNDNLGSFLSFIFQDFSDCKSKFKKTLNRKPQNIQANVLRCVLYYRDERFEKAEEVFQKVKTLAEDEYLMAEAESELAYAFSRMGPQYYHRAIESYRNLTSKHPEEYGWKYRLALTLRRAIKPDNVVFSHSATDLSAHFQECKALFQNTFTDSENPDLKALSHIGLSVLIFDRYFDRFQSDLSKKTRQEMALENLELAKEYAPSNEKVLTEAGRILRRMKLTDEAIEMLEKAVTIRETRINCHHLGLAYSEQPDVAIGYLEKAVELSQGLNTYAIESLGMSYECLSPPNTKKALEWFEKLISSNCTYDLKRNAYERAAKCYLTLFFREKKSDYSTKVDEYRRKCLVCAALTCLQQPSNLKESLAITDLFGGYYNCSDYTNCYGQYKRIVSKFGDRLTICQDIRSALRKPYIDDRLTELIYSYLRDDHFEECLDLTTMLLPTTLKNIKETAIDVMMKIVEIVGNYSANHELVKTCFTRAVDGLCPMEGMAAHVRIICDVSNCKQELELIEGWLTSVDLKVVSNDEDIFKYMGREEALISAMSQNLAIICLSKENNMAVIDDYPLHGLPVFRPFVTRVTIGNCEVSPKVAKFEPIVSDLSDTNRGKWLSEFGRKTLSNVIKFWE